VWLNNYGLWVDEFEAMSLLHCLDTVWPLASIFISDGTRPESLNDIQECMAARLKQLGICRVAQLHLKCLSNCN
jgi:hypothetical protein